MKPCIVVYCCTNSTVAPEDHVEKVVSGEQAEVRMVRLPCSGRTDVLHLVRAIEDGADVAMVVGCPEGACRFIEGNTRAKLRVQFANKLLAEAGVGRERVVMVDMDSSDGGKFAEALKEAIGKAKELGPWSA